MADLPLAPLIAFFLLAATLCGLGLWWAIRMARKRREAFQALCAQNGWTYAESLDDPSPRFPGFRPFGTGLRRHGRDGLAGTLDGLAFEAFTYLYTTTTHNGKTQQTQTHAFTVVAVPMPLAAPNLTIDPETLGKKLFDALGGEDIDFESDAFSRAFWVKCGERRFAYDVVTPAMMEHLLAAPRGWHWQWSGTQLVAWRTGRLGPADALPAVQVVRGFVKLLPRHLLAARPA